MTTAFIWDLDGTLLDSYDAILAGIEETYAHYGLDFDREGIHSINFCDYRSEINQKIEKLMDIQHLFTR